MKAGGDLEREDELDGRVRKTLQAHGVYYKIRSVGMVGLYLAVFVKEHLVGHVTDEDADRVRTSTEGIAGKKGGVALRFLLGHTSMCFVNVHFPSGDSAARAAERTAAQQQVLLEAFQGKNEKGGVRPP